MVRHAIVASASLQWFAIVGIAFRQITAHAFAGFAETMKLPALPTSTLRFEFAMNAHALIDKDTLLR